MPLPSHRHPVVLPPSSGAPTYNAPQWSLAIDSVTGAIYINTDGATTWAQLSGGVPPAGGGVVSGLEAHIDGGGRVISTGLKGFLEVPFNCTITGWTLLADQSGSIVIDVWKDSYGNFPPTVADTIAGTEKPTLASVQKNQDLTLSTWTTGLLQGDVLGFNVDSVTTVTWIALALRVTKG